MKRNFDDTPSASYLNDNSDLAPLDCGENTGLRMTFTYKHVQERLRDAGIVMSKRGGMHRINFFGGLENTAYYTDNLEDALGRGIAMAETLKAASRTRLRPQANANT